MNLPMNGLDQGDQMIGVKIVPNFGKSSQNSHQAKIVQLSNIKAQVESPKHLQQTNFEHLKYQQQTTL